MKRECRCNTDLCLGCERRRADDLRAYDAAPASLRAWLRKQPLNVDAAMFHCVAIEHGYGIEAVAANFIRAQRLAAAQWRAELAA